MHVCLFVLFLFLFFGIPKWHVFFQWSVDKPKVNYLEWVILIFIFFLDNFWHLGEEGLFSGEGDLFTIVVTIDISTSSSSFFPLFYLSISIVLISNYQIPIFVIDDLPNSLFSSLIKCIKIWLITLSKLQITSLKFGVFKFYIMKFQILDFIT